MTPFRLFNLSLRLSYHRVGEHFLPRLTFLSYFSLVSIEQIKTRKVLFLH